MRLTIYFMLAICLMSSMTFAQVAIGTDGAEADGSAILDLQSSTKGFLCTRLSAAERDAITDPAAGLIIYNTDRKCIEVFDGILWTSTNPYFQCGDQVHDSDSNVYGTILIGNQCWMTTNINVGTMINSSVDPTDNDTIEKYCYVNLESYCDIFGGLYRWDEMMQYSTDSAAQGICPVGWHIAWDSDWKLLEGTADSIYPQGDEEWDLFGERGYDAGKNLKSTEVWYPVSYRGTDLYGFNALPGGLVNNFGDFSGYYVNAYFWSSVESSGSNAYDRQISGSVNTVTRYGLDKDMGLSVRCILDGRHQNDFPPNFDK